MAKSKRISGLDCSAPAGKMIQLVLRTQLKSMCALRDKALDGDDPEGVHDMRVASRRLRSAISDFKPFLRKPGLPVTRLRAIARSLGAVRDEDVALAALAELKSKATGDAAEGIEMLAEERRVRRAEARLKLERVIKRSAVAEFRKEFVTRLDTVTLVPAKKVPAPEAGEMVFGRVGVEVIKARLKELRDASPHLYSPFEIKELHELRILAKRLRYAIELFGQCWEKQLDASAKEIAHLQTSLGELHDCDVWIESLGARLKQIARRDQSDPHHLRQLEGATWLFRHFTNERMEHYRGALACWQQWDTEEFLDRLTLMLESCVAAPDGRRIHSLLIPA